MNSLLSILMGLIFLFLDIRNIRDIRELKVATKKSAFECIIIIVCILFIVILAVMYGESILHYIFGILAIIYMISKFFIQGISSKGIFVIERGGGFYSWDKIKEVDFIKSNIVKVTFFRKERAEIITHKFLLKDYKEIFEILNKHYIKINIKQK